MIFSQQDGRRSQTINSLTSVIRERVTNDGYHTNLGSIRDYDSLLESKPPYSPPYIHKTEKGQRVSFQTWVWNENLYQLTQYIIEDEDSLQVSKFTCEYRATRREELTKLFLAAGCRDVIWKFPEETAFYQPILVARK